MAKQNQRGNWIEDLFRIPPSRGKSGRIYKSKTTDPVRTELQKLRDLSRSLKKLAQASDQLFQAYLDLSNDQRDRLHIDCNHYTNGVMDCKPGAGYQRRYSRVFRTDFQEWNNKLAQFVSDTRSQILMYG